MSESEQLDTVRDIMKSVRTCMLTTISPEGAMHSAPMTTQEAEFDGEVWFIAGAGSDTVRNLRVHPDVNLSYSSDTAWLSVSGRASVAERPDKKDELWNTFVQAWFPEGKDDPNVCVIKVEGDSAQYWESPGKVVTMASMLKARVTHTTPDVGEGGKVDL